MTYVEYSSNNSGGSWWLDDDAWLKLEQAGWEVRWIRDQPSYGGERLIGALATSAIRRGLSLRMAIAEWEDVTGERSTALGCSCCGVPHYFSLCEDDGTHIDSYSPDYPSDGDPY